MVLGRKLKNPRLIPCEDFFFGRNSRISDNFFVLTVKYGTKKL